MKPGKARDKMTQVLKRPFWPSVLVMAVCCVLVALGMILATSPERYNLAVGDIATKTITATKDVVDEISTEAKRDRAAEGVQSSYREDEKAATQVLAHLDQIFTEYEAIRAYGEGIRNGTIAPASAEEYSGTFSQADLDYARALSTTLNLSDWQLKILMRQDQLELSNLYNNTKDTVAKQMESTIREGQIETSISAIQRQLMPTTSSDLVQSIAIPAVRASIVPNMVVDQEATAMAREAARLEVEPLIYKSGQNIVVAGERVDATQLALLESLGLLEGNQFDFMMMIGVSLLSVLAMLALLFHVLQFVRNLMGRFRNAVLLAVIFAVTMIISVAIAQINPYLAPTAMVLLLVATLLSPSMAVISNLLALILVSVLTNTAATTFTQQMLDSLVAGILCAPIGIFVVNKLRNQRASVLVAGLVMGIANLAAMVCVGLLTNSELKQIIDHAVWSAGGYVLAGVLCMGMQPILEWAFNLVTPFKLVELSNPNQPLLRRLLVETPGTYHHSIMVANLAEAAAEAIGADPLLTRVGAYYHDIGKLKRPLYFKENQLGDNPHDRTDPRVSAAIITEHVTDGIIMARQHRLPEQVIAFIPQHHGDTTVGFFYHKMLNMEGGADAKIEDFQYPGPKPQTAEAAILMLADTVEAAIRAGGDQSAEVIEKRIMELVSDKINSGQLNESPLKFADVQKISRAFAQVLVGIYHKRIEYPSLTGGPQALPQVKPVMPPAQPVQEEQPAAQPVQEEPRDAP